MYFFFRICNISVIFADVATSCYERNAMRPVQRKEFSSTKGILYTTGNRLKSTYVRREQTIEKKAFPGRKTLRPEFAECTCIVPSRGVGSLYFILFFFFCKIYDRCFISEKSYLIRDPIKIPRQRKARFFRRLSVPAKPAKKVAKKIHSRGKISLNTRQCYLFHAPAFSETK